MIVAVADRLGKSIREVMEFPTSEIVYFFAFLQIVNGKRP